MMHENVMPTNEIPETVIRGSTMRESAVRKSNVGPRTERPRFLGEADCREIAARLARFAAGGGYTALSIISTWTGNVRWARNQINTLGEVRNNTIDILRSVDGADGTVRINDTTDAALIAAVRRAERLIHFEDEKPTRDLIARLPLEPSATPTLFSEATYNLDASHRAAVAIELAKQAKDAGMLSAGYVEVAAVGMGVLDTLGRLRYFAYTQARYSVTVRDPNGTGSGWAGVDWYDWHKIDAAALTEKALKKCLSSRNPVAIEPGRYTTLLEPQAVADVIGPLFQSWMHPLNRNGNEGGASPPGPFLKSEPTATDPGYSRIGEKVADERITVTSDPMDPDAGFPPFWAVGGKENDPFVMPVYHLVTWIDHGVLTNLAYDRDDGIWSMGRSTGLPNSGALRMSGGDTSVEEMIATTKRGLLVTRCDQVGLVSTTSQLYRGYTRDGLWLIENGKISKPVKNMEFTESILFALNNVEQLGPVQRVFHPNGMLLYSNPQPTVVPPLKIRDFSFTALADAV